MQDKRNRKLARRLALWAVADQIDHESVDKHVLLFSKNCNEDTEQLNSIQAKIDELNGQKKLIAKKMIKASTENIFDLINSTENKIAKPLVDLAFWNRLQDMNPELYGVLHPNMDEIGDEKKEEEKEPINLKFIV